jgi:hypothetical protein
VANMLDLFQQLLPIDAACFWPSTPAGEGLQRL